jgi:hypothetical protein
LVGVSGTLSLQTQLLNIAQGALSIAIFIGSAWLAKKTDQTLIVMALWLLPAIAGTVVLLAIKVTPQNAPGMLIAFYCTQFVIGEGNLIFVSAPRSACMASGPLADHPSWRHVVCVLEKRGGSDQKDCHHRPLLHRICQWRNRRTAAVPGEVGERPFRKRGCYSHSAPNAQATDSPRYTKAWICHLCLHGAFMALCMFTRLLLMRRNAKKRGNSTSDGSSPDENVSLVLDLGGMSVLTTLRPQVVEEIQHKNAFADLTDKQNPDFRYVY